MKNFRFICFMLIICISLSLLPFFASAEESAGKVTGETSRTTTELTLADGTKTGVIHTNIQLSGYYGNDREINIAEGDLSNTNLSLEFINSGSYMIKAQTINKSAAAYTASHRGQTVVAAVNGDLYMTSIHSGSSVTKKVLGVPRGILIIDGEIWASAQVDQENLGATNIEQGQPAGIRPAFGVTNLNQPIIGMPVITTTLDIGGKTVKTDGINRIPAMDAIMVYNHRVNSSNYALDDSYEVELVMHGSSAFTAGGTIKGTIINVYEPGSTERPSLANEKTIVITARGSRIEELRALCSKGKRITFSTELVDLKGHTDVWQNVQDALGGHMQVLYDGEGAPINQSTYYPTTLIGYKDDGTVALVTVTSTKDKSRNALKISQSYELCKELGYNSAFYLDGGGSTTFVTLEEGTYTIRNKCSDGSARAVMGGIGFVWNETPVCIRQGDLNHMTLAPDYDSISPVHLDGALIDKLTAYPNYLDIEYVEDEDSLKMEVTQSTNDPFVVVDYTKLQRVNAENYPYMVIKLRTSLKTTKAFAMYYACGGDTGLSESRVKTTNVSPSGDWQYVTFYLGGGSGWSGNINMLRLDVFNDVVSAGDTMHVASVTLCKSADEASKVRKGILPAGAFTDFKGYLESLKLSPQFTVGDITADGLINSVDFFRMKLYIKRGIGLTDAERYAADVNGDGLINAVDSLEIRYRLAKGNWRY